jgi:phospholipid/cholesterol/gamma-HCH transport system substrate-binding protein
METKANHLLIGAFVLVLAAGIFGAIIWLAHIDLNQTYAYYVIYFTDSVAGLGPGGDVRFNGIKVGSVQAIDFDESDSRRVKVTVEVAKKTPIRQDSYAILQLQGITGLSFVQISGGTPEAKLLKYRRSQPIPEIHSRPSQITQLIESAPEVLARAMATLDRLNQILGPENQKNIAKILADAAELADDLAAHKSDIDHILAAASASADDVALAAKSVRSIAEKVDHIADQTGQTMNAARESLAAFNGFVNAAYKTAERFGKTAEQLNTLLAENRDAVNEFAGDGLPQLVRLIGDAHQLVLSLNRVAEQIERDPGRFLFGDKAPERKAQ